MEYKGSLTYTATPGTLSITTNYPTVTSTVLTNPVDITFSIILAHPIESLAYINLIIPDTVLVLTSNTPSCFKTVSGVESSHACTLVSNANNKVNIKMLEFCSANN